MTFEDFSSASDARAAVERNFELVGEACRRLRDYDPETAQKLPGLNQAIGTRNVIAHEYDGIDYGLLWRAIQRYLPELQSAVFALLQEFGPPGGRD